MRSIRELVDKQIAQARSVSLRARIAVLAAGSVAVAVLLVAGGAWFLARHELLQGVDTTLERRADFIVHQPFGGGPNPFEPRVGGGFGLLSQVIDADGNVVIPVSSNASLPVSDREREVAASDRAAPTKRDVRISGLHLRVLTAPIGGGHAVMIASSLNLIDSTLARFALFLVVLCLVGIVGAAAVGQLVARSSLRPVERLTKGAEHVARTQDLNASIDVDRGDELGRLGASFNAMLSALSESRTQQQRLVADASHELRTPLTSLRTNIEVLSRAADMEPDERERLLSDLNLEMQELSDLVNELVLLATGPASTDEEATDVRLDEIATDVVDRARRRTGQEIVLMADPVVVRARPGRIERAMSNLVDNACKWNPIGKPIDVTVEGGTYRVRDRGPGISAPDLPFIFDRFYRAPSARQLPGSGLGLAIVKHIIEEQGGTVFARTAEDGGAVVGFEVPDAKKIDKDTEEVSWGEHT